MIKTTYYIGMNDKDSLKQELSRADFVTLFDEIFKDYTLIDAQGRFTNENNEITHENTLITITFIDDCELANLPKLIENNCSILKETLNQESILVEITKPEVLFC